MPEEVKPDDLKIDAFEDNGVVYLSAVDIAYFISVTEDAELAAGSPHTGRRWDTQQRDAIATVVGKIRTKICGKAAGR